MDAIAPNYEPWTRIPKLPVFLRFPGGYVIPISLVPRPSEYLADDEDASFHTDAGIFIWQELTPNQQWHRLTHEYVHAWVDWQRWVEIKTKRP